MLQFNKLFYRIEATLADEEEKLNKLKYNTQAWFGFTGFESDLCNIKQCVK